ncbi:holliday junction resolvase RusA-like protein [Rhizobium phage RHph_I1_6]|uniref:Holliday junction resolvase RusA-like protein n=1 Tax=Rhizobium phage RHph_I1_6 TaxID=2509728 RepID=A0A7S5RNR9_9CAUD|nr:RusA-like Holliday junction resolvase [Rhizobium phage RHph_I1_6]QIG76589.1 holliday junction resolvase RusA-like protein [Rhizobium phage RHph_I1_6]
MYQVTVPIYLAQSKKKTFALNLNIYRNAHFLLLNKMKVKFKDHIWEQLTFLPTMGGVKLIYTLFMGTNREADLSNICVIVDKFFCDALVEAGKLPDDNVNYLQSIDYRFGGVDKNNPRVEITLEPTSIKEDTTMRISLVQSEIELALERYIGEQLNVADGKAFKISLAATRGEQGFTAEIDIVDAQPAPEEPIKGAKRGPRNKVTEATGHGNVFAGNQTMELVEDQDPVVAEENEVAVGEDAPTAEEAGVPAFLQNKKSIFGNAAS